MARTTHNAGNGNRGPFGKPTAAITTGLRIENVSFDVKLDRVVTFEANYSNSHLDHRRRIALSSTIYRPWQFGIHIN